MEDFGKYEGCVDVDESGVTVNWEKVEWYEVREFAKVLDCLDILTTESKGNYGVLSGDGKLFNPLSQNGFYYFREKRRANEYRDSSQKESGRFRVIKFED